MKRFAVVVTALILALSQHAAAQSGCRPGFINPQRFFPSNEAKPSRLAASLRARRTAWQRRLPADRLARDQHARRVPRQVLHHGVAGTARKPDRLRAVSARREAGRWLAFGIDVQDHSFAAGRRSRRRRETDASGTRQHRLAGLRGQRLRRRHDRGSSADDVARRPEDLLRARRAFRQPGHGPHGVAAPEHARLPARQDGILGLGKAVPLQRRGLGLARSRAERTNRQEQHRLPGRKAVAGHGRARAAATGSGTAAAKRACRGNSSPPCATMRAWATWS